MERAVFGDNRNKEGAKYVKASVSSLEEVLAENQDIVKRTEDYVTKYLTIFKQSTLAKLLEHHKYMLDDEVYVIPRVVRKKEFDPAQVTAPKIEWYSGKVDIVGMVNRDEHTAVDPYGYVKVSQPGTIYLDASRLATDMREEVPPTAVHELAHCLQFMIRRYNGVLEEGGHDKLWMAIMESMHQTPRRYADVSVVR